MTLTRAHGPLSGQPSPGNYQIDGPAHRLFFERFPRRVRAVLGGETVLDSRHGMLLHETGLLPQLYVPEPDVRTDLMIATEHTTHCPFKGDASYWTVQVGDRVAENAVWAYPQPIDTASWLVGYRALYWGSMDEWLDEDERVTGHLCDPYHRVDIRRTSSLVRVLVGDEVLAETREARLLSETGWPNRYYLPRDAVRPDVLARSDTSTVCPYKGTAGYHTIHLPDGRELADAVWFYADPLDGARQIRDHLCFDHPELVVEVDGEAAEQL
jgi:uncharacterized protein (DUF427 family)